MFVALEWISWYYKFRQGRKERVRAQTGKKIFRPPKADQEEKKQGNKVDGALHKIAAGRKYPQHNKPNYIW